MTVASEITRLQTAKANIKTSIENKWVTVPANATLDSYSWYIDQIEKWDPRGDFLVTTILRTPVVTHVNKSDGVSFFGADMTYVDDDVMILTKPWMYDDYSSTSASTMTVYINAYVLDWTSLDFTVWSINVWGYGTNWSLTYGSYHLYKDGDDIHFKICYEWYWSSSSYPTLDLVYNKTNKTFTKVTWSASSRNALPNTGNMWLYTASWEWCTGSNCDPLIKWTPVLS